MTARAAARRRTGATLAASLVLAAVGCGGGDADGEDGGQPPSAVFATTADALCRDAQAEQEEIRRELGGAQVTLADRARLLVDLAPAREELARRLGELEPSQPQARPHRRLVAAAERRAVASARAGERWQRERPRKRIAAAAAREHDERELFVELAGELGLRECAERLRPEEVGAITTAIERGLTGSDRERCATLGTRLLTELYGGGVEACVEFSPPLPRADRVRVREVEGIAEVFAVARLEVDRRQGADRARRLRIVHEDGAYRIDKFD